MNHIVQTVLRFGAAVLRDVNFGAFWQRFVDVCHHGANLIGNTDGGCITRASDGQSHIGLTVSHTERIKIGKAVCYRGYLPEPDEVIATSFDDNLIEFSRRFNATK